VKNTVEVCLTPDLIHQHDLNNKVAVVVDIFRATTCMVRGLVYGVKSVTPVATVEECLNYGKQGYIMAGERGGQKLEEFDIGNSPFEYENPDFIGRKVAITTTNGTQAIEKAKGAEEIVAGSFLNLTATADYLTQKGKSIIILCAGWKGTPNIEDTLFAGSLIHKLPFIQMRDSTTLSHSFYLRHQKDLLGIAKQSGHARRLAGFGIVEDIEYCMRIDDFQDVIIFQKNTLIKI